MSTLTTSIKTILGVVALLVVVLLVVFFLFNCKEDWCYVFQWQKVRMVNNFEDCITFGLPVSTSSPRQCIAGNKSFTEALKPIEPIINIYSDMIHVTSPLSGSLIRSPLTVTGEARGPWYFEASFPLRLIDANGKEIARINAQAKSDWMTTDFVPFESVITFGTPKTETGTLILENDNPSGLPEKSKSISIPVRFYTAPNVIHTGLLEGSVSIGPICPVERVDNPCKPTPEMYATQKIFIYLSDRKTLVTTLTPDAEGIFSATLAESNYWLDTKHQSIGGVTGAPTLFQISASTPTIITISIDTGIR